MRNRSSGPEPGETSHPEPQERFLEATEFEVVYGGARGGGKTDAALGDFARHAAEWGVAAQGLLIRRNRVALEPTIVQAGEIYATESAKWFQSRSCFEWPTGARLYFRYLANDNDAALYQGRT